MSPQNIVYDEGTGKYYDEQGRELTIADGAPVPSAEAAPLPAPAEGPATPTTIDTGAPPATETAPATAEAAPATSETPTTVIDPATGEPTSTSSAAEAPTSPAAEDDSSSDGELLDVEGVAQVARVRYTEREATDTEPAEYREDAGNVVVGADGALRFRKLEAEEGGNG